MWLSFLIAAYIYGLQTPSTLAPFVVAFLVALIVSIVLLIKAWGDEDKPRPVRAHNPKVAFFHMLVGFHIPMAAITLALLSRDEIDRRVIVIGLVLFLLIFGLTWYTVWERIRENLKADSLK
jgi:O-antigen/teichoic acid export membrane protein